MPIHPDDNKWTRQWSLLLIYNIYRLVNIIVLFGLFWTDVHSRVNGVIYCSALLVYLFFGLIFLYLWYVRAPRFKQQILVSGTIDTIVMVLFIYAIGYIQSGLGILLLAPIAMLSILAPGRLAIFFAAVASCMLLAISIFQYEYGLPKNSNTFFSTGMYGAVFFATALTAWYFAHWVRISEGLATHRGLELESMQRLNEYIVSRLQYGVIYVDADMHIRVINDAAQQFFNFKRRDKNIKLQQLSPALYHKYIQFLTQKKTNRAVSAQSILDKPYLQVHFMTTSSVEQPAVLIILDDMAVISQQVQQLKLASLGRFSAGIAHELRNPLGIVSHAVELLREGDRLNEEDSRLTELMMNNCKRMNAVIRNVLDASRRQQAKPEVIELVACLKQFIHDYCLINTCEILINSPQHVPTTIVFDKVHLEQVLVILCDNAMQHGRDEEGHVHISISVEYKGRNLILLLCDKGPGIPVKMRDDVFEPFFSTVNTGVGMGLFIAKDLCEINQTVLSLVDTKKGSCFAILFNHNHEMQL